MGNFPASIGLICSIALCAACSNDPVDIPDADTGSAADLGAPDQPLDLADVAVEPDLGPMLNASDRGEHAVGVRTVTITDAVRARALDLEVWYPASTAGTASVLDFEVDPNRTTYDDLLASAPDCASRTTAAARSATPAAGGPWPVVVFSHCHACMRYSSFSVAEHLASWGYIVIAPDHESNTLFDELRGEGEDVNPAFLTTRAADVRFALDEFLSGAAVPELADSIDAERVGAMGHSFGSVTTGLVTQDDDRIKAALGFAAPMENPLLPGVTVADLAVPLMFVVAMEDNSIREIGNRLIRDNFAKTTGQAYKVEVADAGHWSFSDVAGLTQMFDAGCGDGIRQTDLEAFTYLDPATGRAIAAAYALAFFEAELDDSAAARRFLAEPSPFAGVEIEIRP